MHVAFPLGYNQSGNHYHHAWRQQTHYDGHRSFSQALTGWDVPVSVFKCLANNIWNEPRTGFEGLLSSHTQHTLQACHCQMSDSQHHSWYECEWARYDSGCLTLLRLSICSAHTNSRSGVPYNYCFQRLFGQVQATQDIHGTKGENTIHIRQERMMKVSKGQIIKTFQFD
jgi:hypothetical protein